MYKKVGVHAVKFLLNFWVILLFVFNYGLFKGFFEFNIASLFYSLFGVSGSVMEWWFIPQYMVLLIVSPPIICLFKKNKFVFRILPLVCTIIFVVLVKIYIYFFGLHIIVFKEIIFSYIEYFTKFDTLLVFFVGIIIAKSEIYSFYLMIPYNTIISCLCIILSILVRFSFSNNPTSMSVDFIVVPLFVFGTTTLLINTKMSKILIYFAKHSTNIWLTHTFWCYYFFQDIVLIPYYSIFIYLWLLVLSLLSSYLINLFYIPISNLLFSKRHKFSYDNYFYFIGKNKKH